MSNATSLSLAEEIMIQAVRAAIESSTTHQTAAELALKGGDSSSVLESLVVEAIASKRSEVRVRVSIRQWNASFYGLGFQLTTHGNMKVDFLFDQV